MGNAGNYFLSYLVGLAFISNALTLLDIPHNLHKGIRRLFRKHRNEPFVDTWYFDIGYY